MINIVLRQTGLLLISLFTLSILTFTFTELIPKEHSFYFNELINNQASFLERYFDYLQLILQGEWGQSRISGNSVLSEFLTHIPATLELAIAALLLALCVGLPLGVFAAENKNKWPDKLVISTTLIGYSMPIFWWGMLLVLFFSLTLGITPVASRIGFEYDILPVTGFMLIDTLISTQPYALEAFFNAVQHLILPTIVLATIPVAIFARVTRSAMIEVLSSDYIRNAKAKGLPYSRIIWVHALRNALIPIITVVGLQISVLITGTLITETIFSWPGIGKWLLEAVHRRDLITIHGGLLGIAIIVIFTNILVEIATYLLNPRIRHRK
ncbi:ABC transporter permease subunit [Aliikangiella sp. IMCC44653]